MGTPLLSSLPPVYLYKHIPLRRERLTIFLKPGHEIRLNRLTLKFVRGIWNIWGSGGTSSHFSKLNSLLLEMQSICNLWAHKMWFSLCLAMCLEVLLSKQKKKHPQKYCKIGRGGEARSIELSKVWHDWITLSSSPMSEQWCCKIPID